MNTPAVEPPVPPLVERAMATARAIGFPLTRAEARPDQPSCSMPGVGRALAMLAAGCAGGRIGEIGTGTGVGAAWMVSAMPADATLVTVELEQERAAAAAELFADDPRVRVLQGDATELLPPEAPFDLLFVDGGIPDRAAAVDLVRVGGRMVVDDVNDEKRELFFGSPRLVSMEVATPDSVLIGTRVR